MHFWVAKHSLQIECRTKVLWSSTSFCQAKNPDRHFTKKLHLSAPHSVSELTHCPAALQSQISSKGQPSLCFKACNLYMVPKMKSWRWKKQTYDSLSNHNWNRQAASSLKYLQQICFPCKEKATPAPLIGTQVITSTTYKCTWDWKINTSKVTGTQHDTWNKYGITSIVLILGLSDVCKEKYVIYINISDHFTVNFIIWVS